MKWFTAVLCWEHYPVYVLPTFNRGMYISARDTSRCDKCFDYHLNTMPKGLL